MAGSSSDVDADGERALTGFRSASPARLVLRRGSSSTRTGRSSTAVKLTSLSRWKTGKVKSMANMFAGAGDFNSDLSKWDTRQVTDMRAMFQAASTFNSNIGRWVTSKVTDMKYMFEDAGEFNQALCWPRSKTLQTTNMWKRSMIGRWGTGKPGACF